MPASVILKIDKAGSVVEQIKQMAGAQVLVGIPQGKTERKPEEGEHGPMTNATLGYIHEFGSPAANIPARPFLIPGIKDAKKQITERLEKALQQALAGDSQGADRQLSAVGLVAQNSVKAKISEGDFEPLSDATLRARAARGRKGAKAELASRAAGNPPNNENARPLIDTGQLRASIAFVVRKGST